MSDENGCGRNKTKRTNNFKGQDNRRHNQRQNNGGYHRGRGSRDWDYGGRGGRGGYNGRNNNQQYAAHNYNTNNQRFQSNSNWRNEQFPNQQRIIDFSSDGQQSNSLTLKSGSQYNWFADLEFSKDDAPNNPLEDNPEKNSALNNIQQVAAEDKESEIRLKEPTEPTAESKLLKNVKLEQVKPSSPKQKKNKIQPPPSDNTDESSCSDDEKSAKNVKTNVTQKPVSKVKIKKEKTITADDDKRTARVVAAPKAAASPKAAAAPPPLPSSASSSEESSSSDADSSDEEEIPKMPQPKPTKKLKKEPIVEDDVVCLGQQSNFENLVDDNDVVSQPCVVCKKKDHPPLKCAAKCTKCSHCAYKVQMVCQNCGETYGENQKSMPKPENPFFMFMQFMQYCMSQYGDSTSSDIKYPFPQFENQSAPVLEPIPPVEVTHKDIENSKGKKRKRNKAEKKRIRKKSRHSMNSDTDSDSDSSSIATSSKKRKKSSKTSARAVAAPQTVPQSIQQQPQFGRSFPGQMPFATGLNPLLAFSQMMGYNAPPMNFQR